MVEVGTGLQDPVQLDISAANSGSATHEFFLISI
jgi:hypothetical protein